MQRKTIAKRLALLLLLASSAMICDAFSHLDSSVSRANHQTPRARHHRRDHATVIIDGRRRTTEVYQFPPPMGGPGRGGGPPPPPPGGPMGGGPSSFGGRSVGMGGPPPGDNRPGQESYNANNSFNAGNTGEAPRQGEGAGYPGSGEGRGLGAIASGVRTPMDKYGRSDSERRRGSYGGPGGGGYRNRGSLGPNNNDVQPGPTPTFNDGRRGIGGKGRLNNLRYEERDYGEYVTNLRSGASMGGPGGPGGPPPTEGGYRDLEEEVARLRKENDLLKRSCSDLLNNFNELSNRLFDVDESLKKVAKVFPEEEEMESLEWLLRR